MVSKWNLRVYGLFVEEGKVLITDEARFGIEMTKFPGGGLKFGESIIECLHREFKEEMNVEIEVIDHFYTTDFLQVSAFAPEEQLLSFYYLVQPKQEIRSQLVEKQFDIKEGSEQCFRMLDVATTSSNELSFPIDKKVFSLLKLYVKE